MEGGLWRLPYPTATHLGLQVSVEAVLRLQPPLSGEAALLRLHLVPCSSGVIISYTLAFCSPCADPWLLSCPQNSAQWSPSAPRGMHLTSSEIISAWDSLDEQAGGSSCSSCSIHRSPCSSCLSSVLLPTNELYNYLSLICFLQHWRSQRAGTLYWDSSNWPMSCDKYIFSLQSNSRGVAVITIVTFHGRN